MNHMSDSGGFDVFDNFNCTYLVWSLFENAGGSWIATNDRIEFWHIFDNVIFPIIITFYIR